MGGRGWVIGLALGVCAIGLFGLIRVAAAPAHPVPSPRTALLEAIATLQARGAITASEGRADRTAVSRAVRLVDGLPRQRAAPVAAALDQVEALADRLTPPRALALFGQLTVNDNWFARHGPLPSGTDVADADGIVYRYFPGAAFEFHPLANFTALNGDATSKNAAATDRLAAALIARGVPEGSGAIGWEYYFGWEGGRAPWLSGFAQAVAAQAFARAAILLPHESSALLAVADAAYRTIPGRLDRHLGVGPWIKLYGFNDDVVLNAQLQTAISLASYAANSDNHDAAALAASMRDAAARALPLFDTGAWTLYALPDDPSPLSYQEYVVQLLQTLSTTDPRFAAAASRFASYQTQPPRFKLADAGPGAVEFWVSKPATVRVTALGDPRELAVTGGWHVLRWQPGRAGVFPVRLEATDWAGNSATAQALPIVRVAPAPKVATGRPAVEASALARSAAAPLLVGAGLAAPAQAGLALGDGLGALRMTLVWPSEAPTPDPSAIAALDRLPGGADLVLELYASTLPTDAAGRAALAAYAAAVASQVPTVRDVILGPAATAATAASYEAALAAVYDAVHQAAPTVRVDGELDGAQAPAATLAALATAYRASGRTAPLMDELAFQPAASAGSDEWTIASLGSLEAGLSSDFAGTTQAGSSLPLIVDNLAFASAIPHAKTALYQSPSASNGLSEPAQAASYESALAAAGCEPQVTAVLIEQLVDTAGGGGQSGLYYVDGTPKASLDPVLQAVAAAQGATRGCRASSATAPSGTPTTTAPTTTSPSTTAPAPTTTPTPTPLITPGSVAFPGTVSPAGGATVRLGCTEACLYLVTLQRASDGTPVLANRGALAAGKTAAVRLPRDPVATGGYRFAVWAVPQDDPVTVSIVRSASVAAG